jgi:hypothetical protein
MILVYVTRNIVDVHGHLKSPTFGNIVIATEYKKHLSYLLKKSINKMSHTRLIGCWSNRNFIRPRLIV